MGRGVATNHAGLPQHTTLHYAGDPKLPDARLGDTGSRAPDIPCSCPESSVHEYVERLIEIMGKAHDALRAQQWQIRTEDSEEPPLYQVGD